MRRIEGRVRDVCIISRCKWICVTMAVSYAILSSPIISSFTADIALWFFFACQVEICTKIMEYFQPNDDDNGDHTLLLPSCSHSTVWKHALLCGNTFSCTREARTHTVEWSRRMHSEGGIGAEGKRRKRGMREEWEITFYVIFCFRQDFPLPLLPETSAPPHTLPLVFFLLLLSANASSSP